MLPLLSLLAPLLAQTPAPQAQAAIEVDPLLIPILERHGLPAIAGAVVTTEGLAAVGAIGLRSQDGEGEVTAEDLWHLGSCTKAMTATLAARLVEMGELGWDTTVGEAFADLRGSMDPHWRDVPIRLLLCNRGGAPADLDSDGLWGRLWTHTGTPREQRRTLVEGVLKHPPKPAPGTEFVYSNAGFAIAGAMLETVTDMPWEDLMRREVFVPLGMKSAGFGAPGAPGALDQPLGHHPEEKGPRPQPRGQGDDNPAAIGPAGTLHASLADWARFAQAHLRGARGEGDYLKPETWKLLHTPLEEQEYAFGWGFVPRPWAGGTALTHSGSNTMWFCTIWLAPERGFGVLAATNVGGEAAAKACDEVASALIGATIAREQAPH